jgi:hypothetical protein
MNPSSGKISLLRADESAESDVDESNFAKSKDLQTMTYWSLGIGNSYGLDLGTTWHDRFR